MSTGEVHYRLVSDAIVFMKSHGNREELQALYRLENIEGGNIYPSDVDERNGFIMRTAGLQAVDVDHYSDLQSDCGGTDRAEWHSNWMTGLNHYINAFVSDANWDITNGYFYPWSPHSALDEEFHSGWFDFFNVHVEGETDKSPVLERLRPYWRGQTRTWENNWGARLPFSEYAPCSALASMYYDQLINHYADAMHVSVYGNKPNIVGLEKLGPVLHTIGDTIVPQHVRCTHGCLHDEWEHTVETLVLNGLVGLNVGLVRDLLLAEPFNKGYYSHGGPLDGLYAVDWIITKIADMNRDKVLSAKGMDITTLWNATEDPFWKDFYKEQTGIASTSGQALAPNNCMNYLYNLGVAAIVHTLKRTSEDLLKRNIGSPVLPPYLAIDTAVIVYALEKAIDPPTLSEEPGLLLGFAPTGRTPFPDRLRNFEQIFRVDRLDALNPNQVSETLAAVQGSAERELLLTGRWQAAAPDENLPRFDSSFGIYAVTCPTLEECPDRQRLNQYLDRCEVQHYKAHLLNPAMTIATLNATARAARLVGTPLEIDQARQSLERQRYEAVRARAILRSQPPVPASPVHLVNPGERPIPQNVRAAGR